MQHVVSQNLYLQHVGVTLQGPEDELVKTPALALTILHFHSVSLSAVCCHDLPPLVIKNHPGT